MASRGVNKVILVGNVGGDPEIRYMPNGNAVANLSLATSDSWKDKQTGQQQDRTEWHRIVFFGKIAEIVGEYVTKGTTLYIEGRLQTRKWQGQDGQDRYTTEIVVDQNGAMQMLSGSKRGEQGAPSEPAPQQQAPRQPRQQQAPRQPSPAPQQPQPDYDSFDDDIPF